MSQKHTFSVQSSKVKILDSYMKWIEVNFTEEHARTSLLRYYHSFTVLILLSVLNRYVVVVIVSCLLIKLSHAKCLSSSLVLSN